MDGYEGLSVYRKAYSLVVRIYKLVQSLPKEEMYGLSSQMRRASVSVPLNIAEGYGRRENPKDYRNFLLTEKGSCNEMQVLCKLCVSLGFLEKETAQQTWNDYEEVCKMLYGIMKGLWFCP